MRVRVAGIVGAAVVVIAACFVIRVGSVTAPGVTEASFYRLEPGMSLGQVEKMLGRPADSVEPTSETLWFERRWRGDGFSIMLSTAGQTTADADQEVVGGRLEDAQGNVIAFAYWRSWHYRMLMALGWHPYWGWD
jgi:hypothetical protein